MLRAEALLALLLSLASLLLLAVWAYGNLGFGRSLGSLHPLPRGGRGRVSVVIAARDEEENLRRLLPPLLGVEDDRLLEVIVVDDGSSDGTPRLLEELARRYPRLRYVRVEETPRGWAPKSYALSLGASMARGEVLLFLDADVEPRDPRGLVEAAASTPLDGILALAPRFSCRGWRCKAAEAVLTGVALGFYGFHRVQDPGDSLAWIYGCCWAISRGLYESLGGHEAVRSSLVEDRDFASHAKSRGVGIVFADAYEAVSVKAYESLLGYSHQIARLSLDPLRARGRLGRILFIASRSFILYGAPVLAPLSPLAAAALALQLLLYARGARLNGYSPLHALPALAAQAVLVHGMVLAATRGFSWKGRSYSIKAKLGSGAA